MTEPLVLAFGLCAGSFLNVCIHRIPRGKSVVRPRSRCPLCGRAVAWHDNVPLLSYALLGGRCRDCGGRISRRYPAVELLTALLALGLWRRWEGALPWTALAFAASTALVAVAFIDWDTFLIPDALSLGLLGAGLLASPLNPLLGAGPWTRMAWAAVGTAAGFLLCWATAALGERLFKKEAMGGGDIKLLAAVGAWSGAQGALDCLLVASLLGSVYGVGLMLKGRIGRSDPIPFGPFLSAAAILNFFYLLPLPFWP